MTAQTIAVSNDTSIPYVDYQDQPVVTFAMVDRAHHKVAGTSRKQFAKNRKHFSAGEDLHRVDSSQKSRLATFGITVPPRGLIVLTESGYLLLAKSFTDGLAWQVQKQLVKTYFQAKTAHQLPDRTPPPSLEIVKVFRVTSHGSKIATESDSVGKMAWRDATN
ncbi:MAG: hypothetical protein WBG92_21645, partial [Thiohalocapsa sp.]